jgi:hypothetical protein
VQTDSYFLKARAGAETNSYGSVILLIMCRSAISHLSRCVISVTYMYSISPLRIRMISVIHASVSSLLQRLHALDQRETCRGPCRAGQSLCSRDGQGVGQKAGVYIWARVGGIKNAVKGGEGRRKIEKGGEMGKRKCEKGVPVCEKGGKCEKGRK